MAQGIRNIDGMHPGYRHGDCPKGAETPEYRAWVSMRNRCSNPHHKSFRHYGGRGIRVCEDWQASFTQFLADVGRRPSPKHSLDRHPDNEGNYEPGNVRWATARQQANNRQRTIFVDVGSERLSLGDACRRLGLVRNVIWMRIDRGMSPQAAIDTPVRRYRG